MKIWMKGFLLSTLLTVMIVFAAAQANASVDTSVKVGDLGLSLLFAQDFSDDSSILLAQRSRKYNKRYRRYPPPRRHWGKRRYPRRYYGRPYGPPPPYRHRRLHRRGPFGPPPPPFGPPPRW